MRLENQPSLKEAFGIGRSRDPLQNSGTSNLAHLKVIGRRPTNVAASVLSPEPAGRDGGKTLHSLGKQSSCGPGAPAPAFFSDDSKKGEGVAPPSPFTRPLEKGLASLEMLRSTLPPLLKSWEL